MSNECNATSGKGETMDGTRKQHRIEGSRALAERLRTVLPGGDTRSSTFYSPFPIALERGEDYRVWDVDGNAYLDFWGNYTSLVHGNAHPAIVQAIQEQAARGTVFPAPHPLQAELAERLIARVASVDRIRFTNSGTEAIMLAGRAARAFTGRDEIVKVVLGYHGSWDQVALPTPGQTGVPAQVQRLAHLVEYNDLDALEATMARHGSRVAALFLEPVLGSGGVIPIDAVYARRARELADRYGALLVLDEIITLRLRPGGYQEALGISPDLTTMGKIIGGGLPVGALGGRAEIMDRFDPRRPDHIPHGGTFNGNALTMAAGCVSLDLLTPSEIARINALGDRMAAALEVALTDVGFAGRISSAGSLLQIHTSPEQMNRLHWASLQEGIVYAPRGMVVLSTAMDEAVIDRAVGSIATAAKRVATTHEPAMTR
jgi:glutamate-1-semialdehyde 2,1-aminomutase